MTVVCTSHSNLCLACTRLVVWDVWVGSKLMMYVRICVVVPRRHLS